MRVSFGKERETQKRETEVRGDKLSAPRSPFRPLKFPLSLKGTLHETILDDDFWRNTVLQHCFEVLQHCPTLQSCAALKIVVANHPV